MTFPWWGPLAAGAVAAGLWWALRRLKKLPTVRVVLAGLAGLGIAVIGGHLLESGIGWVYRVTSAHFGNWALLIPALVVALFFFALMITVGSLHPKTSPDKLAEWLAVITVVFLFTFGGTISPALHSLGGIS